MPLYHSRPSLASLDSMDSYRSCSSGLAWGAHPAPAALAPPPSPPPQQQQPQQQHMAGPPTPQGLPPLPQPQPQRRLVPAAPWLQPAPSYQPSNEACDLASLFDAMVSRWPCLPTDSCPAPLCLWGVSC